MNLFSALVRDRLRKNRRSRRRLRIVGGAFLEEQRRRKLLCGALWFVAVMAVAIIVATMVPISDLRAR
jgi:hypothetical protein